MRKPKNKLSYHRMRNFLSQKEVANHLGISAAYYCKLEKNPDKIDLGMAIILKEMFKANHIDDLIGDVS